MPEDYCLVRWTCPGCGATLKPKAGQDLAGAPLCLPHIQAVKAGGIAQVFQRRELLEESCVDRNPVDETAHRHPLAHNIPAHDRNRA